MARRIVVPCARSTEWPLPCGVLSQEVRDDERKRRRLRRAAATQHLTKLGPLDRMTSTDQPLSHFAAPSMNDGPYRGAIQSFGQPIQLPNQGVNNWRCIEHMECDEMIRAQHRCVFGIEDDVIAE